MYTGTFADIPIGAHTANKYAANVTGAEYTPLNGEHKVIAGPKSEQETDEGLKEYSWIVDNDYPTGTWFILHGVVWPGQATFWFLGVYQVGH